MVRSSLIALLLVVSASACSIRRPPPTPIVPAPSATLGEARAIVRSFVDEQKIPGFAVTVSHRGNVVWQQGFGLADREAGLPADSSTQFRVGSVSKILTATELMWLSEQGRIDLDAPVSTYLDLPAPLRPLTLRQLAGHLGGIRHYRDDEFLSTRRYASSREALAIFIMDPLISTPGAVYSYSSYGYNLIGAVLEATRKLPFPELLRRDVLEPLRMRRTVVDDGGKSRSTRALGYTVESDGVARVPYDDLSGRWPSGGYLMTTDDMARLGRSILAPGLLSAASLATMLTPQRLASGDETPVGIGWRISVDSEGRSYAHHGGSSNGGRAFLVVYPKEQLVVAMAANALTNWGEKEALALAQVFLREP